MKVIVTGSRHFNHRHVMNDVLGSLEPFGLIIVHGGCKGADRQASEWAKKFKVRQICYPADWSIGPKAGPLRNQRMVDDRADLCVAFWNGWSRGTYDCIKRAIKAGIPTEIHYI